MFLRFRPRASRRFDSIGPAAGVARGWVVGVLLFFAAVPALGSNPAESPSITVVQAVGTDVEISFFRGSPAPIGSGLDVVVTSPLCGEIGRAFTPTLAETTVGTLADGLATFLACGPQYTALLEGINGPVGRPLAFRAGLSCDPSNVCDFVLESGVEAQHALILSEDLAQAMDQATGTGDLVDAVTTAQPALGNEMLTYALHLDRLRSQAGGWGNGCECQWVGILELSPMLADGELDLWADEEVSFDDGVATLTLETELHCYASTVGPVAPLTLPGAATHVVPAFDRCTHPLPAPGDVRVTYQLVAKSGGTEGFWTQAVAEMDLSFDEVAQPSSTALALRVVDLAEEEVEDEKDFDSGVVSASRIELSIEAEAKVIPSSSSSNPPNLGACVAGEVDLSASYPLMDASISVVPKTNYPIPGEDPVACRDTAGGGAR